jgi:hypothetical protein
MTVDVMWMWMWCLDKRDHAISEAAEILGGGHLKAMCKAPVYPLGASAEGTRRYCRGCVEELRTAPESSQLPQRVPGQVLRQLLTISWGDPMSDTCECVESRRTLILIPIFPKFPG